MKRKGPLDVGNESARRVYRERVAPTAPCRPHPPAAGRARGLAPRPAHAMAQEGEADPLLGVRVAGGHSAGGTQRPPCVHATARQSRPSAISGIHASASRCTATLLLQAGARITVCQCTTRAQGRVHHAQGVRAPSPACLATGGRSTRRDCNRLQPPRNRKRCRLMSVSKVNRLDRDGEPYFRELEPFGDLAARRRFSATRSVTNEIAGRGTFEQTKKIRTRRRSRSQTRLPMQRRPRNGALFERRVGQLPERRIRSGRITQISPYCCALAGCSAASSLNPPRALVKASHSPSGDQAQCASLPGWFVKRRAPVPSGSMVYNS